MSAEHHDIRERLAIAEHRQDHFDKAVGDIRDNLVKLSANLEIITRIDERQAAQNEALQRAFTRMDRHSARLKALEHAVPQNTLGRVLTGQVGLVLLSSGSALIGAAVMKVLFA